MGFTVQLWAWNDKRCPLCVMTAVKVDIQKLVNEQNQALRLFVSHSLINPGDRLSVLILLKLEEYQPYRH